MAAGRTRLFVRELHFLQHGRPVPNAISVKLHSHSFGVEISEKDLNLEYVLAATCFRFDFAEMKRVPLLF